MKFTMNTAGITDRYSRYCCKRSVIICTTRKLNYILCHTLYYFYDLHKKIVMIVLMQGVGKIWKIKITLNLQ